MRLQFRSQVPDEAVARWEGHRPDPNAVRVRLTGNVRAYHPNGDLLCVLVKGALRDVLTSEVRGVLRGLRSRKTFNRGSYSGTDRVKRVRSDGTVSPTTYAEAVPSAVVGFMPRYPRNPYCRETAWVSDNPDSWAALSPLLRRAAEVFATEVPDRYEAQARAAGETHPAWVIPGTPFTTVTVNYTFAGATHKDAGDFKAGFGVLAVARQGSYRGCELVFPSYQAAVDLEDGDVLLFDPHQWHGNTPFIADGEPGEDTYERISLVLYHREDMLQCGSPAEELERARSRGRLE